MSPTRYVSKHCIRKFSSEKKIPNITLINTLFIVRLIWPLKTCMLHFRSWDQFFFYKKKFRSRTPPLWSPTVCKVSQLRTWRFSQCDLDTPETRTTRPFEIVVKTSFMTKNFDWCLFSTIWWLLLGDSHPQLREYWSWHKSKRFRAIAAHKDGMVELTSDADTITRRDNSSSKLLVTFANEFLLVRFVNYRTSKYL